MFKTIRCSEMHCGHGVKYYHQGMIAEAIDAYYEMLGKSTTRDHIIRCWLGIAYFHNKMLDEAVRAFQKILDLRPELSIEDYHFEVCSFCSELTAEIINLFVQILKKDPHHTLSYYYLGVAHYYKGDLDKSIDHLIRATQINGENNLYANSLAGLRKARENFYEGS
jgi:tetratricopeptide (TPR) repeat protein